MPTESNKRHTRLPDVGPRVEPYDRYRFLTLGEDEFMIYDTELEDGWLKSRVTLSLEAWR